MNAIYCWTTAGGIPPLGQGDAERGRTQQQAVAGLFDRPNTSWAPRVLKDGADSLGMMGALLIASILISASTAKNGRGISIRSSVARAPTVPIEIETAEKNSAYWTATEIGTPNMAQFLAQGRAAGPDWRMHPGGDQYLTDRRSAVLDAARWCLPRPAPGATPASCLTKRKRRWRRAAAPAPAISPVLTRYWTIRRPTNSRRKCATIVADAGFPQG